MTTDREAHDAHCEADVCHCGYTYAQHEGYGCGCPGFVAVDRGCECTARRRGGVTTATNETQTIDADALRARLAETPADLRGRIEAALRARHGNGVTVEFFVRGGAARVKYNVPGLHCDTSVLCHDENDGGALGALAYAVGLNADGSDPSAQGEALAHRLHAEREAVVAELDRTRDEVDALESLVARQADILTGVANALRGEPAPLASHSHHDLAERAAAMVALLAVTQSSLEAASSGRRVTACDEIERLQRERDAALAVVAGLREEISDTADTLHRLSHAQQRLASQGSEEARAMGDAYLRAAQIVAAIGDPARAATVTT